jgi:energy-coupling factor transporter ATP-binding protein EcfA2
MTHSGDKDYIEVVRELLIAAFTAEDLRRFCQDRPTFRPIVARFGPGHGLDDMVDEVVTYCDKRDLFGALLAAVSEENPPQYARFEPALRHAGFSSGRNARAFGSAPRQSTSAARLWRWLASRYVYYYTPLRRRYLRTYCENLAAEFRTLNLLGRDTPLDLEKIYIALRMSRHARPDLLPDPGRADVGPQGEDLRRARRQDKALEVEAALGLSARLVILGDPGAGKTTLLKHLALRAAQGDPRLAAVMPKSGRQQSADAAPIPLFVTLNDLTRDGQGLVEGLADALERRGFPHARLFVERALAQGRCLCLLDGLDEVVDDQTHERLAGEIDALAAAHPGNLLLVTSRIAGYRYLLRRGFTLLDVAEFDREQIRCFVETWFAGEPRRAEGLLAALDGSPGMRRLAANPLLLSIIAWVYEKDMRLPERRVELYDRCVWVLLEEWEHFKGLAGEREFPPDLTRRALAALALRFQQGQRIALDRDQLLAHLAQILPKADRAEAFLEEVLARTGLLRQMSRTSYAFTHLTVQEFLAAQAVHQAGDRSLALGHLDDPWWRETIVLLAGLQRDATGLRRDATGLIREILAARPDSLEALLLAVRCLADADETEPALRADLVGRMVAWAQDDR